MKEVIIVDKVLVSGSDHNFHEYYLVKEKVTYSPSNDYYGEWFEGAPKTFEDEVVVERLVAR